MLVFEHTEGILLRNPDIHRVITVPARPGFLEHLRLIRDLFRRYDLAITTLMGDRPTLYAWIAGKTRIGMQDGSSKQSWKQHLLSRWAGYDHTDAHTVLTNLGLADLLGIKRNHEVVVAWNPSDENSVAKALPFDIGAEPFTVLHMYPKFRYKMWQRDGWIGLAQWLKENGIRSVLTGGNFPDELAYVEQIFCSMPPGTVNMAGKLSLAESAFLISRAKYYVGPDTALTHVAAALGIPTIALFGPSNPVKWGPWPKSYAEDRNPYRMKGTQRVNNVMLLQGIGDCVPCVHEGCDRHTSSLSDCLQDMPAARVIAALQDISREAAPRRLRKIAVVVPKYGLVGGGERFASEITERLAKNENLDIHVFANQWVASSDRIKFHKVPAIRFPRFLRPLVFAWFTSRMISRMNFDLVHSHDWILKGDLFSVHSVPHAGWVREIRKRRPSLFDRAIIAVERKTIKAGGSSRFFPVSTIAIEAFRREYATLPGQWQALSPGVDVARFSTPDRAACRADIRGYYGIGASDILLLFVGMNFEVKGLDTIIAALAKARVARPEANIRLLVVGRGDEDRYRKMAHSLGIAEAVAFAGTQIEGLERYYRAADIFIMLSKFDTFGMVVLEAMAAGLPVIVSPNVGAKDLVQEGVNGFILPAPHDVDTAVDRIVRLSNREQLEVMGAAATQTASMHDWDKLAEKMERLYQEIFSEKPNKTEMERIAGV